MDADELKISYGRGHLLLALPAAARATVIRKTALPQLPDPAAAVAAAFERPVGSPPLAELASGRRSACILICDITRPVPNRLFLRPMIETMLAAGIPLDAHHRAGRDRTASPESGRGAGGAGRRPVGARDTCGSRIISRAMTPITSISADTRTRGTPVKIDRRFVEADLRIATGLVEPHFMAGWSGGRKVIAPGVAHHETIRTFHSARFMEDPLAVQCNLEGNPLHEEQLEIVRMLGDVYALNTVHRRGPRPGLRDLRRDHCEPSGGGRFRRRSDDGSGRPGASRRSSRRRPAIRSTRPTTRRSRAW